MLLFYIFLGFLLFVFICIALLVYMGCFSPIEISEPAIEVAKSHLGRSSVSAARPDSKSSSGTLIFSTDRVTASIIGDSPSPRSEAILLGRPETEPSKGFGYTGLIELRTFFSIHNVSELPATVYDFHASVYHVSAYRLPPLNLQYRPRIELTQDNSIIGQGKVYEIPSGRMQAFELVFETSLFDTGPTAILFGLFADFKLQASATVTNWRLPSDRIYVLQHSRHGGDLIHFVGRDRDEIRQRLRKAILQRQVLNSFLRVITRHCVSAFKLG